MAPFDIELDTFTLVQPDVFVLPPTATGGRLRDATGVVPILVIEVLSPGTARTDLGPKRLRYQRAGLEYWAVSLHDRHIERLAAGAERMIVVQEVLEWLPPGASTPFRLRLRELFAEARKRDSGGGSVAIVLAVPLPQLRRLHQPCTPLHRLQDINLAGRRGTQVAEPPR